MSKRSKFLSGYVILMSFLGSLYVILGCVILFGSQNFLGFTNLVPSFLGHFEPIPRDTHDLWVICSGSFFIGIAMTCYLTAIFPENWGYRLLVLVATLMVGVGTLTRFGEPTRYFAYLFIGTTQAAVAAVVVWKSISFLIRRPFAEGRKSSGESPSAGSTSLTSPPPGHLVRQE